MIVLFTDFGGADLYVGQVKAVLAQHAPGVPVIDLLNDAPAFNVRASAHLLAALVPRFPVGSVFLGVVDPGVGGSREAAVVEADGRWFVGPDNGLLSVIAGRANAARVWRISWRPIALSATFNGRDLFAPIAAWIAAGRFREGKLEPVPGLAADLGAGDLAEIIYVDHYGNAMTGLRGAGIPRDASLAVAGRQLIFARTYAEVPQGTAFWYENSLGLVELAVNKGHAARMLGLAIGEVISPSWGGS